MKTKIQELLKQKCIKHVVYVDNDFETANHYSESIKAFLRHNINNTSITWPFSIEAGIDFALNKCDVWLYSVIDEEIQQFVNENNIVSENAIAMKLKQALPSDLLVCLTPDEFEKQYIQNFTNDLSKENQLLILMDKYVQEDDGSSGMRLLTKFKDQPFVACGLFSSKFTIDDELQHWSDCESATNIYPLSKQRINDIENDFLKGLFNVLWLQQMSEVKQQMVCIYNEAWKQTQEDIKLFDPGSFERAIITQSGKEGCWEFDMMKRILLQIMNNKVEEVLLNDEYFNDIQTKTKLLKQITITKSSNNGPVTEILRKLYHSEIYANIDYVNSTYSQIANGDIFDIQGNEYMLVCQPCNLELRNDASRKSSEFVYLLPIAQKDNIKKINNKKEVSILQNTDGTNVCLYVKLNEAQRITPYVLDLVCYNVEGLSILSLNEDNKLQNVEMMQDNLLKHYNNILQKVKSYWDAHQQIKNIPNDILTKEEQQGVLSLLKNPFELGTVGLIQPIYNIDEESIYFNIKRVKRYNDPYAQIVLQDFMAYQCRQALPCNLSK